MGDDDYLDYKKREHHNLLEKQRREQIKESCDILKNHLFCGRDSQKNRSKAVVLQTATRLIRKSKQLVHSVPEEVHKTVLLKCGKFFKKLMRLGEKMEIYQAEDNVSEEMLKDYLTMQHMLNILNTVPTEFFQLYAVEGVNRREYYNPVFERGADANDDDEKLYQALGGDLQLDDESDDDDGSDLQPYFRNNPEALQLIFNSSPDEGYGPTSLYDSDIADDEQDEVDVIGSDEDVYQSDVDGNESDGDINESDEYIDVEFVPSGRHNSRNSRRRSPHYEDDEQYQPNKRRKYSASSNSESESDSEDAYEALSPDDGYQSHFQQSPCSENEAEDQGGISPESDTGHIQSPQVQGEDPEYQPWYLNPSSFVADSPTLVSDIKVEVPDSPLLSTDLDNQPAEYLSNQILSGGPSTALTNTAADTILLFQEHFDSIFDPNEPDVEDELPFAHERNVLLIDPSNEQNMNSAWHNYTDYRLDSDERSAMLSQADIIDDSDLPELSEEFLDPAIDIDLFLNI